jgi:hypothetical protein
VTSSANGATGWLWTGRRRPKQRETAALQRDWAAMARDHAAESRKARRTSRSVPPRAVSGLPTSRRSSIWEVSALERRLATEDRRRPSGRRPAQDRAAAAERDRSRAAADREQAVVDRAKRLADEPETRRHWSQQVMAPSDCLPLVLGCRQPRAVDAGKRGLGRPARGERVRRNGCSPRLHGWVATETGHESASRRHWFERAGGRRTVMRVVPVRLVAAWTVASRGPRPRPYLTRHPATACWPAQHPRRCSLAC